jgi:mannosyltransferase OCH1-like enzyme
MPIPKTIYQTWKTKDLSKNCQLVRNNIQKLNPEYEMILYDDNDIDNFIKHNFDNYVYSCYSKLNVGAAKADFWRYCILYKYGGIYLDIDSEILSPFKDLIKEDDSCIITREGNKGVFNNWIMIYEKNHPILKKIIEKCCFNITNKTTNYICLLTGPEGPCTESINEILIPLYNKETKNLYFEDDNDLNIIFNKTQPKCRFYGIDMEGFARFHHDYSNELYNGNKHWRQETKIFKDL